MRAQHHLLALALGSCLTACSKDETTSAASPDDTGSGNDEGSPDDTGETGDDTATPDDTAPPDDTGAPPPTDFEWTAGPPLPDCSPTTYDSAWVALSGVLLSSEGATAGVVVYDRDNGEIVCAGDCDTSEASVVCTQGIISAGLIDSHNHMQYNALAPWQHDALFDDRYDWRSDGDYWDYRTAYDVIDSAYKCEIMKWAELRSLVAGTTSVVGSSGGDCINPLIRNLDEGADASGIPGYRLKYSASTVTDSYEMGDIDTPGSYFDAVENHVGEGVGGSVTHEISHMLNIGMEGPGQIYVHATDATTSQLARMADKGTAIAWSPRSNLDLYAATTPADIAHRLGVPLSLAPDWTWSGSMSPARELSCVADYLGSRQADISDITMWSWTTDQAARVLNLDATLGLLSPGFKADISVFAWSDQPYRTVIAGDPKDVRLVMVNGNALYGETALVESTTARFDWCEPIDACGESRTLCAKAGSAGDDAQTATDIEDILSSALGGVSMPDGLAYASELLGLFICEDTRSSCDISNPTDTDTDGDGIDDTEDLCLGAYDPLQRDFDSDGVGDVCDPCPLAADQTECSHTPGDIDGDGIPTDDDDCPWLANADQADSDDDGHGDVCDLCPDEPNPGDMGCTYALSDIRDPSSPLHPPEGTAVTVTGVVVTGIKTGSGFYVQDPDALVYGGIFVYDSGSHSEGDVSTGDVLTVTGVYSEFYGLAQIGSPGIEITGSDDQPTPIDVSEPCSIATDGASAESLESMVVRVSHVTVTDANPDAPDDYQEFELASCLRVDDQLSDVLVPQPVAGTYFSQISGVLSYTYGHAKLEPRGAGDVVE